MIDIKKQLTNDEKVEALEFLKCLKALLATNDCEFQITLKNKDFNRKYPLKTEEKFKILSTLTLEECIAVENNNNPRYDDSRVFKFLKNTNIYVFGEPEKVNLYIKMYIKEYPNYDKVVVISFHEEGIFD